MLKRFANYSIALRSMHALVYKDGSQRQPYLKTAGGAAVSAIAGA
jgi:hypothetical protein